jgi:hypothetical protein
MSVRPEIFDVTLRVYPLSRRKVVPVADKAVLLSLLKPLPILKGDFGLVPTDFGNSLDAF